MTSPFRWLALLLVMVGGCIEVPSRQRCSEAAECPGQRCDLESGRCLDLEADALPASDATGGRVDMATPAVDGLPPAMDALSPTPDAILPPTPDAATPDAILPPTPDAATPDAMLPPTPDAATPDAMLPPTPDAAMPDAVTPDAMPPDAATPDLALPDASPPDLALPDALPPDLAVPDEGVDAAPCPNPTPEICNGLDDDCDGVIDNGFDLQTDVNNCGACGRSCNLRGAVNLCRAGECTFERCQPGAFDRDHRTDSGCEFSIAGAREWWVDDDAAPGGNGSYDAPFRTVDEAVAAAGVGDQIWVWPGDYTPAEDAAKQAIRIQGVEPGEAHFRALPGSRFRYGTFSELVDLELDFQGANHSIGVEVTTGASVIGCHIFNADSSNGNGNPIPIAAVKVTGHGARLVDSLVETFTDVTDPTSVRPAGDCNDTAPRGPNTVVGVYVDGFDDVQIVGNTIQRLRGGSPAQSGVNLACATPVAPAEGGLVEGIALRNADRAQVSGNVIQDLVGGRGGDDLGLGFPGNGGSAIGVNIYGTSVGNVLRGNTIQRLTGGPQGNSSPASAHFNQPRPGRTWGVYVNGEALDQDIDPTNTVGGDPVYYFYNAVNPPPIEGCRLTGRTAPLNWGKMAIFRSRGVRVTNCTVANLAGGAPRSPGYMARNWSPIASGATTAIYVSESSDVVFEGLDVHDIQAPLGTHPAAGAAYGVHIMDSTDVEIRRSTFSFIASPPEGELLVPARACHGPGEVQAVRVSRPAGASGDIRLIGNTYHDIGEDNPCVGTPALAAASRVFDTDGFVSAWELVYGLGGAENRCVGVHLRTGTTNAEIQGLTYVPGPACLPDSASVEFSATGFAALWDSVLAAPVRNPAALPRNLEIRYSQVPDDQLATLDDVATVGPGVIGGDPGFVDPAADDYALLPDAPGVDAGDPMSDCDLEPPDPDPVCHADLGHTGNTAAAHAVGGR